MALRDLRLPSEGMIGFGILRWLPEQNIVWLLGSSEQLLIDPVERQVFDLNDVLKGGDYWPGIAAVDP